MNQRCLYCYRELGEGEIDYHPECATNFFGCETVPIYPFDGGKFTVENLTGDNYVLQSKALAMRMAQSALILTIPNTLARNQEGNLLYLSKIDKSAESLDVLVARLEGCEFDGSVEMIAELVEDFSSIAKLDIVTLFEHVIFGWVAGCHSMNLSSFSLSRPNAGVCSLSAAYDFVPTSLFAITEDKSQFALEVNGRREGLRRSDFEFAMRYMGLKDRIIRITIEKMIKSKDQWIELIKGSMLSEDLKSKYISEISSRLKILER